MHVAPTHRSLACVPFEARKDEGNKTGILEGKKYEEGKMI